MPEPLIRNVVTAVYDMAQDGKSSREIAQALGIAHSTAARLLRSPEKYDPYLDEIAIARALGGERPVFDALTVFEWEAFLGRLKRLCDALPAWQWQEFYEALTGRLEPSDNEARIRLSRRIGAAMVRVRRTA